MSSSISNSSPLGDADFFDGFFKARAGLTSPGTPFEVVDSADAQGHPLKAFKNAFPHLPALLNAGRAHGAKEFIVQDGERWSFDRFFTAADALAGHLQYTLGVQPGDRVAFAMRNRPEWAVAFVAASLAGAVPVPLNSYGLHDELAAALRLTTPRVLVADTPRLERLGASVAALAAQVVEVPDSSTSTPHLSAAAQHRPAGLHLLDALIAPGGPGASATA